MLRLIKLEFKKNQIQKYALYSFILAGILCLFIFAMVFLGIVRDPDTGQMDELTGMGTVFIIEPFANIAFLIFASAMLSAFIVKNYKNKTMYVMFSYPIKRQVILLSQMLSVWIFTFFALVCTKLLIYSSILIGSKFMRPDFLIDYDMTQPTFYIQLFLQASLTITMSFTALFVGIKMNSTKATIITSFVLILFTQANVGDFTLSQNTLLPIILAAISLVFAYLSIRNAETADVN